MKKCTLLRSCDTIVTIQTVPDYIYSAVTIPEMARIGNSQIMLLAFDQVAFIIRNMTGLGESIQINRKIVN